MVLDFPYLYSLQENVVGEVFDEVIENARAKQRQETQRRLASISGLSHLEIPSNLAASPPREPKPSTSTAVEADLIPASTRVLRSAAKTKRLQVTAEQPAPKRTRFATELVEKSPTPVDTEGSRSATSSDASSDDEADKKALSVIQIDGPPDSPPSKRAASGLGLFEAETLDDLEDAADAKDASGNLIFPVIGLERLCRMPPDAFPEDTDKPLSQFLVDRCVSSTPAPPEPSPLSRLPKVKSGDKEPRRLVTEVLAVEDPSSLVSFGDLDTSEAPEFFSKYGHLSDPSFKPKALSKTGVIRQEEPKFGLHLYPTTAGEAFSDEGESDPESDTDHYVESASDLQFEVVSWSLQEPTRREKELQAKIGSRPPLRSALFTDHKSGVYQTAPIRQKIDRPKKSELESLDPVLVSFKPDLKADFDLPAELRPKLPVSERKGSTGRSGSGARIYTCGAEGCDYTLSHFDSACTHVRRRHTKNKLACALCEGAYCCLSMRQLRSHWIDVHQCASPAGSATSSPRIA